MLAASAAHHGRLHRRQDRATAWKDRPAWFLVAEQDRVIVADNQCFMAGRMKAQVRSHPVDHTPLVTAPSAVIDIIREAIGEVVKG